MVTDALLTSFVTLGSGARAMGGPEPLTLGAAALTADAGPGS